MSMENPKYKFNQLLTGLKAFVGVLELRLQEIVPDLPVLIYNTGDDSYYLGAKFDPVTNPEKEIYQKVPRFVIEFGDNTPQTEQDSSQFIRIEYNYKDVNYTGLGRRKALSFEATGHFVTSNYIKALEYEEVLLSIFMRDNAFTYDWMGNTYEGAFNMTSLSTEKNGMDVGSGTKNATVNVQMELTLQPFILRYESIQKVDDLPNKIQIDVNVMSMGKVEIQQLISADILTPAQIRKIKRAAEQGIISFTTSE